MPPTGCDQQAAGFSLRYSQPHQDGGEHKLQFHDTAPIPWRARKLNRPLLLANETGQADAPICDGRVSRPLPAYEDRLPNLFQ